MRQIEKKIKPKLSNSRKNIYLDNYLRGQGVSPRLSFIKFINPLPFGAVYVNRRNILYRPKGRETVGGLNQSTAFKPAKRW